MENRKESCKRYFIYAGMFGILAPILLLIIYNTIVPTFNQGIVYVFLISIMGVVFYPLIAYIIYDENIINPKIIDITLRFDGALSIILIGFAVHYTGGMEKSMLSSFFFFIPSTIAIAFDANKSLKMVIPLALLAVIINLILENNSHIFENTIYLVFYILGVSLQFFAIYKLEITKIKKA